MVRVSQRSFLGDRPPLGVSTSVTETGDDVDIDETGGSGHALDDLTNVDAPTPADGDVLTWDDYLQAWVPAPSGGSLDLDDLGDVNAPTPSDGDVLAYDSGTSTWVPVAPSAPTIDWGEDADISTLDYDDTPSAGVLDEAARADHVHGMPSEGGGGTGSFAGYNTAGGSWVTMGQRQQFCKSITLGADALVESIDCYLRPSTDNVDGLVATILDDNSGAPGVLRAANNVSSSGIYLSNSSSMPGAGRWVSLAMGAYLAAGTYWICVMGQFARMDIAYDGSGGDKYFTASTFLATGAYPSAWSITTSSNRYSIRARITS